MGRDVNRALIKGVYKKHKQELGDFSENVYNLKNNIKDMFEFSAFMFNHNSTTYTLVPLFSLLQSICDSDSGVTYLDGFLVSEYRDTIMGVSERPFNMDMVCDIISNDDDSDIGKMSNVFLTSTYILHDKLGEGFREFFDALGGNIFLAHKNVIGLSLMMHYKSRNYKMYEKKAIEDFLCQYEDTLRKLATIDLLSSDMIELRDVLHFIYLVFKYYIESNSVGGATFDLIETIEKEHPNYIEWLNVISLNYIHTIDSEYMCDILNDISKTTEYVLRSTVNTMHLSLEIGLKKVRKDKEEVVKEVKSSNYKEIKALEKENKLLTKELNNANKNIKKLEKYIDKKKNSNELLEYKQKVEELELKNKQLESKLEGANLRIETLEGRVTTLKNEVAKSDVAITVDKEYIEIPEVGGVSLDAMLDALKGLNIVIVGGTDVSYKRISNYLPNVRYIDAENTANFDIPLNTDYVVLCTKILSHSHTRRAEVFKHSVRGILKINKTNPEEIIKDIYNTVIG